MNKYLNGVLVLSLLVLLIYPPMLAQTSDAEEEPASIQEVEPIKVEPPKEDIKKDTYVLPRDKYKLMRDAGVQEHEQYYVNFVVQSESDWCVKIWNNGVCNGPRPANSSGAYGLCQTMLNTHGVNNQVFKTDALTQMKWCHNYAKQRYGGWKNAYYFWKLNKWW